MNVTQRYLTALKPQLSERDFAIVEMVGKFKLCTAGQLERVLFDALGDVSRARGRQAVLKRLVDAQVLHRVGSRPVGGADGGSRAFVYCLGVAGQHLSSLASVAPRRPYVHYQPNVAHYLATCELYVRLVEADRASKLKLVRFDAEPYCWRDFATRTLKPDAYWQVKITHEGRSGTMSFFAEVDRGDQWGTKISTKIPAYLAYRASQVSHVMPLVLFLSPNERRVAYMERLVAIQAGADAALFRPGLIDEFEGLLRP